MTSNPIDRRRLLRGSAAGALLMALGGPALAACGGTSRPSPTAAGPVELPAHIPFASIPADLPGELDGTAGYLRYPTPALAVTTGKPGRGGTVTALLKLLGGPPDFGRSRYWQEVVNRLGTDLQLQLVPTSDYDSKFATTVAGGDLPDMIEVPTPLPPQLPQLLTAKAQDLTPFLSGDAAKEFPFLANIATLPWKTTVFAGKIFGVPVPRPVVGNVMYRRDDLIAARGLNPDPTTFAEFEELCKGLTDTRGNKWAMTRGASGLLREMLGAPPIWRSEGGKLTHGYELPETRQAIEAAAKLFKDGYVHPDAFSKNGVSAGKPVFYSGAAALHWDGFSAWADINRLGGGRVGAIAAAGYDGNEPVVGIQPGSLNFTMLKKAPDDRVREILAILNWYAAPFGSAEYLFRKYGLDGVHHTMVDGNPVPTKLGDTEVRTLDNVISYHLADSPKVLHNPGFDDATRGANAFARKIAPHAVPDATVGFFSDTDATQGAALLRKLQDIESEIMQGRKSLDDWDEGVRTWRTNGGDKIRAEYEEQLQKS